MIDESEELFEEIIEDFINNYQVSTSLKETALN
jgi:hypothetical protein